MPVSIENLKDAGSGMPSAIIVDFIYDGNGTRAKKADSHGNVSYYIGDHFEVVNGEEVKYIFAGNQRIAKITTGSSFFYHKDHLGSSSVMTDYPAGATVETTEYLPFGHDRDHSGTEVTDYKFTDQEKDTETGLYNYDARMYDPVVAFFISADSVDQDWYDPQKLNRYAYCRNNPLKYIDPTGHYDDEDNHDLGSGGFQSEGNKEWTRGAGGKELAGRRERQTQFENHLKRVDKVVPYMLGAGALKGGKLLLGASKLVKSEASPLAPLRKSYEHDVAGLSNKAADMRKAGMSSEKIGKALHAERNALKVKYRELTPANMLKKIEQRNLQKYGNKLGPSIKQLRKDGKSWDNIIESATRSGGKDLGF